MRTVLAFSVMGIAAALVVTAYSWSNVDAKQRAGEKDQAEPVQAANALMQKKMDASKALLEDIALEDYAGIAESAGDLRDISLEALWTESESTLYGEYGAQFRTALAGVVDMAEKENLQGATLSYMQVVMTCVQCHDTVRKHQQVAELPLDTLRAGAQ